MAANLRLKNEFTEDEKYHNLLNCVEDKGSKYWVKCYYLYFYNYLTYKCFIQARNDKKEKLINVKYHFSTISSWQLSKYMIILI